MGANPGNGSSRETRASAPSEPSRPPSPAPGDITTLVNAAFHRLCARVGLTVIAAGVDNHGGLQWQAGKAGAIDRYITIGLVLDEDGEPTSCEVWVAVDDGTHFDRLTVLRWDSSVLDVIALSEISSTKDWPDMGRELSSRSEPFQTVADRLPAALALAWKAAAGIQRIDESAERYIVARRSAGSEHHARR